MRTRRSATHRLGSGSNASKACVSFAFALAFLSGNVSRSIAASTACTSEAAADGDNEARGYVTTAHTRLNFCVACAFRPPPPPRRIPRKPLRNRATRAIVASSASAREARYASLPNAQSSKSGSWTTIRPTGAVSSSAPENASHRSTNRTHSSSAARKIASSSPSETRDADKLVDAFAPCEINGAHRRSAVRASSPPASRVRSNAWHMEGRRRTPPVFLFLPGFEPGTSEPPVAETPAARPPTPRAPTRESSRAFP